MTPRHRPSCPDTVSAPCHHRTVQTGETDEAHQTLLHPSHRFTRSEVLASPSPVPPAAGAYAWYIKNPPASVPLAHCHRIDDAYLLYVGISPAKPPANGRPASKQNLRTRIRYHYGGNAYGSTLRLTLGVLLSENLGIRLQQVSASGRTTFGADGERLLSDWMAQHATVTWIQHSAPWMLEDELIETLDLPLNLQGNRSHSFHAALSEMRRGARLRAASSSRLTPEDPDRRPEYWLDGDQFGCPNCGRTHPTSNGLIFNVDDPQWDKQYLCRDCLTRQGGTDGTDLNRGRISVLEISSRIGIDSRIVESQLRALYGLQDTRSIDISTALDYLTNRPPNLTEAPTSEPE